MRTSSTSRATIPRRATPNVATIATVPRTIPRKKTPNYKRCLAASLLRARRCVEATPSTTHKEGGPPRAVALRRRRHRHRRTQLAYDGPVRSRLAQVRSGLRVRRPSPARTCRGRSDNARDGEATKRAPLVAGGAAGRSDGRSRKAPPRRRTKRRARRPPPPARVQGARRLACTAARKQAPPARRTRSRRGSAQSLVAERSPPDSKPRGQWFQIFRRLRQAPERHLSARP